MDPISPSSRHPIGLYLHLPFCVRLCHYCDFVKTALYTEAQKAEYIALLQRQYQDYRRVWEQIPGVGAELYSVFWGGGTPSLVDREIVPIMDEIRRHVAPGAEITLEANPEHVTEEKLRIWADAGINRLSLGVQSFQPSGLKALTREHTAAEAEAAVARVLKVIPNCNVDLIYGWPGQTEAMWEDDLGRLKASGATHASLYNLTFEGRTPFARRLERGKLEVMDDDRLSGFYESACASLGEAGFEHEEVSNWALPGFRAAHNALYWNGGSYLGLGAGAHSYFQDLGPYGLRWQQSANWRQLRPESKSTLQALITQPYNSIDGERDAEAWLLETMSSGLRTSQGVNLDDLCRKSGYNFEPRPIVRQALDQKLMTLGAAGQLTLIPKEWFRETRWSLEVALSLSPRRT